VVGDAALERHAHHRRGQSRQVKLSHATCASLAL
jgi:hypothetical protein